MILRLFYRRRDTKEKSAMRFDSEVKVNNMADNCYDEKNEGVSIDIFLLLRKYFVLIVAVAIAACFVGFAFAKLRTPVYTAQETITYNVSTSSGNYDTSAVNTQMAYYNTMLDFCKTGKVLDRANDYYNDYLKFRTPDNKQDIDEFFTEKEAEKYVYDGNNRPDTLISTDTVTVKSVNSDDSVNIVISVENVSGEVAKKLVRIYAFAIKMEAKESFGGISVNVTERIPEGSGINYISASEDLSTKKILVIFGVIGVVLGFAVACLLQITDTSVRSTEELNGITGVSLLSCIEKQEA